MSSSIRFAIDSDALSQDAKRVYDAICNANHGDAGAKRLAIRIASAVTRADGGFIRLGQPLGALLLYGSMHAPLLEYAEILTRTWLGERVDGNSSYVYVDCMATNSFNDMTNFARILGPPEQYPNYPLARLPVLHPSELFSTDRMHRIGAKLNAFEICKQEFFQQNQQLLTQAGEIGNALSANATPSKGLMMKMIQQLQPAIQSRIQQEYARIYEEGMPYRAVIVFDNVESASPELISEVMNKMIHNGSITILGPSGAQQIFFATTIIVLLMHDRYNLLKLHGKNLGFKTGQKANEKLESGEDVGTVYREIREKLLDDPRFSTLMQNVADNMVIIGPREIRQQETRILRKLNELQQQFASKNIELNWTVEFLTMLVQESFDEPVQFYTKRRTNSAFEKCVELPLARAVTQQQLRPHCSLTLTLGEQSAEAVVATLTCEIGENENTPLTAADVGELLQQSPQQKEKRVLEEIDQSEVENLAKFRSELEAILEPVRIELRKIFTGAVAQ